ncbi:MAG: hypothetical protein AB8F95_01105 [Bacteroidia bacterium]
MNIPAIIQHIYKALLAVSVCAILFLLNALPAQPPQNPLDDESDFYAETKQVNQFFRRFNGEESLRGERYYPADSAYQDSKLRRKYINVLFDEDNSLLTNDMKASFISTVIGQDSMILLDFHGDNWFAEVSSEFRYKGRTVAATLYMKLEAAQIGSKWVMERAYVPYFDSVLLAKGRVRNDSFLHPLSHELDFMNLSKVFKDRGSLSPFLAKNRRPDHLTLLIQAWEQGNLRYQTVNEVRFHFFQVGGWYFEVSHFNRPRYNKGWLISKLTQIDDDKKPILESFIQHGQP